MWATPPVRPHLIPEHRARLRATGLAHWAIKRCATSFVRCNPACHFVKNEVTKVNTPKGLEAYRYIIFNDGEKARVTSNIPGKKINLQATYKVGKLTYMARAIYFGSVTNASSLNANFPQPDYFYQKLKPIWVVDASVAYAFSKIIHATIGVNNLFNELGDYSDPTLTPRNNPAIIGLQNGSAGIQPFVRITARL